jgi:hypothetical protein
MNTTTDIQCKANIDLQGNIIKDVQTQLTRVVLADGSASPKTFKRADTAEDITLSKNKADDVGRMLYCVTDSCVYIFKNITTASSGFDWIPLNLASLTTDNISLIESGSGNAVTDLSLECINGKAILSETKGSTFLTSHQSVVNNEPTLNYKTAQAIATIGGQEITAKSKASVTDGTASLAWDTKVSIAEIDGQVITAKLPINPKAEVSNKNVTLSWGTQSTLATIDDTNITVKMPNNPNTINEFGSRAVIGNADVTVATFITTYADAIFSCIGHGVIHFDFIRTSTEPKFSVIDLGQDTLLDLMNNMYPLIQSYCASIGSTEISREITFHFQMILPSVSSIDDSFYHIPIATYNAETKTFSVSGVTYDTQLINYYNLTHTTSGQLFNNIDVQIKFNFGETIEGAIYCSMTPQITLI